jgi:NTE family protein
MSKIRLAFSGSGFRLGAHIGALKAVLDAGYDVVEVAGTSGGSICAALFAAGMPIVDMVELVSTMDWSPLLTFDPWSGLRNGGYCSGDKLLAFLHGKTGGKTFAELSIDLKIIASDLGGEKQVVFSKATTPDMPIALAARASASIPFVYTPVKYQGMTLVDGGCCDNLPADALTVDAAPRLGVYLLSDDPPAQSMDLATMAGRVIDLMLASNEDLHVASAEKSGARIVRVETAYANSLDRNMPAAIRQRLFDDGYAAADAALKGMA